MHAAVQLGYQIALYALCVLILFTGEGRMKRTALVILAVMWVAAWLGPFWPSEQYAWSMIGVNSAALVAICWQPAGMWQSIIGLTYIMQVTVHFGRIFLGDNADINGYWWGLSLTALLQLGLLGWWWGRGHFAYRRGHDQAASHSGTEGMAR